MQVTETLNSGLKREITVKVPADNLESKLAERLESARGKAKINGFRPGKVPLQHLRKMYGKSLMAEVVNEILNESPRAILAQRGEKAAMQPEVTMTEDEAEAEKVLSGESDFEFKMVYEVIPAFEIKDFTGLAVTRPIYDVPESEVDDQVKRVAASTRGYNAKDGAAAKDDRVVIDYLGKVDGVAFSGGEASDYPLVLGSGEFIPGFEDQLVGVKTGDARTIKVTFPENYSAAQLAGKEASFDVTVKAVESPEDFELNDEIAQSLGLESLERLRSVVRGQIESQFGSMTRQKVKRQLLDQLDAAYTFESPSRLVDAEFNNIWTQVTQDLSSAGRTFTDEDTTEEEARSDYQKLAERRVRLGLVLAEIGEKAGVQVNDQELQRALFEFIRRFPTEQQQNIYDLYRNNPSLVATLRAPIFEEKVVDHLLEKINITDKKVSKDELMAEDADELDLKSTKSAKTAEKDDASAAGGAKKKASKKTSEKGAE